MRVLQINSSGAVQLVTPDLALVFTTASPIPPAALSLVNGHITTIQNNNCARVHHEEDSFRSFSHSIMSTDGSVIVGEFNDDLYNSVAVYADDIATALAALN